MNDLRPYMQFAKYYDLYVGDFDTDLPLYISGCKDRRRIVEIGCGTGRVLAALVNAGYQVTGVDISDEMLRMAEAKLRNRIIDGTVRLINHNFVNAPMIEGFDCALVTFYTFNYLLEEQDQRSFLANLERSMADGGVFIADLFFPAALVSPETTGRWKESVMESEVMTVRVRDRREMVGSIERREQVYIEHGQEQAITTLRRFVTKQQMEKLLQEAGFRSIRFVDRYDIDTVHELKPEETTTSSYVVMAEKG